MLTLSKIQEILINDDLLKEVVFEQEWFYKLPSRLESIEISSLTYNSKETTEDALFFIKGLSFKEEYLMEAVETNGLKFYIAETVYDVTACGIVVKDVKKAMSLIAQAFFEYPQDKLKIVAFTGTKGKTTAAYFVHSILSETTNNKVAMLSTMNTTLDGKHFFKSELTTPESLDLFRMMKEAVGHGMTHLVMEVSSQAYKTNRVYGLKYDVGVFLNISPDHIGPIEHPTFEDYFYAKRQIIKHSKAIILNHECEHFDLLIEEARNYRKYIAVYGENEEECDLWFEKKKDPLDFSVKMGKRLGHSAYEKVVGDYHLQLLGDFNKGNAVSAILASILVGASKEDCFEGLRKTTVPGRMEMLETKSGVRVYVDYAHNKISLEFLLQEVRKATKGKVIVVIGSPGNKGESRRKDFGEVLSNLADVAYLTADDPNRENPKDIADEINQAITQPVEVHFEMDREEAIAQAIARAESSQDTVVLAGKGADCYQIVNGVKTKYDGDFRVAQKIINEQE